MAARTRTRDLRWTQTGDTYHHGLGTTTYQNAVVGSYEQCQDVVGNRDGDNPLDIVKQSTSTSVARGIQINQTTGLPQRTFNAVPLSGAWQIPSSMPPGFMPAMNSAWLAECMVKGLARTNPQAPDVVLPAFLAELREFPGMAKEIAADLTRFARGSRFLGRVEGLRQLPMVIRQNGTKFLSAIAKGNLQWRFGIAPTIGDVTKLLKFTDVVSSRLRYLERLKGGRELRMNATIGGNTTTVAEMNVLVHSSTGYLFRGNRSTTYSYKEWVSCRWKSSGWPLIPDLQSGKPFLAARQAYGINSFGLLSAAWELTPWSWLADWFGNFGDFLKATNRSLGLVPSQMCVMRMEENTTRITVKNAPAGVSVKGTILRKHVAKRRRVVPSPVALPLASLPVLTTGQWSILGSLSILRARVGRRSVRLS